MKSVLVVGAGPAGLVAAKSLLYHDGGTKYKVTIFDSAKRVGGMWGFAPDEFGSKCRPQMRTNLSRFTVSFSDLSWASVDLTNPLTGTTHAGAPPMFPQAWQVGRYLDAYARKFLPENIIHLNREVRAADFVEHTPSPGVWNVSSVDVDTEQLFQDSFDHLVVASGFFDQPAWLDNRNQDPDADYPARQPHSSKFCHVEELAETPGKIVVVGGGMSGSEAAATAAFQISSSKWSPGQNKPHYADAKVYHIFNRPFYCLPRYIPQDAYLPVRDSASGGVSEPRPSPARDFNTAPHFLPLDLVLYNLSRRGEGPISSSNGQVPAEKAVKGHEFIRSLVGGDQGDLGRPELVYRPEATRFPAYTGVTDTYTEFVRSGIIIPIQGRAGRIPNPSSVQGIEDNHDPFMHYVTVVPQSPWAPAEQNMGLVIDDVSGIIEASGYQVHLNYLSDRVKKALDYDPNCRRLPFLLSHGAVFNPNVPQMAFIGFYEGPYWGFMEAQARLVAQAWNPDSGQAARPETSDLSESRLIRQAIKDRALDLPQFSMGDYVGLMEEFSRATNVERHDYALGLQEGPAFPARYVDLSTDNDAFNVVREVEEILKQSQDGSRFVAAAVFRGLQGIWSVQRGIDLRFGSVAEEAFKGISNFHPREPTDPAYASEYFCVEEGIFTAENGSVRQGTDRYIYRYNEDTDTITVWFPHKDGFTTGTLLDTWKFRAPEEPFRGWLGEGEGLCHGDTFKSRSEFWFRGASLQQFSLALDVLGPKRDYTVQSMYSRPE
ncbi:hypothetical protein BU26DRAFT_129889 [Trematosphaeria pertusa]|uniref:Uncharacterized protein n=1 Tax=Trematosphaeria pertusa TaxID=390896 RepID=A0A6A6HYG0_9PLEO|nr:uncharacterized protein BU26DRAFT_129889 [Trematosphaeria pertusa]KAF2242653.1 hypothetical protein BU26DRAFT_129889 [Trematosphaeria pertusa]